MTANKLHKLNINYKLFFLGGKSEVKRQLRRPKCKWEDNIKMLFQGRCGFDEFKFVLYIMHRQYTTHIKQDAKL